jgi:hypothetical protein
VKVSLGLAGWQDRTLSGPNIDAPQTHNITATPEKQIHPKKNQKNKYTRHPHERIHPSKLNVFEDAVTSLVYLMVFDSPKKS